MRGLLLRLLGLSWSLRSWSWRVDVFDVRVVVVEVEIEDADGKVAKMSLSTKDVHAARQSRKESS